MNIAIVAPSPVPLVMGGAENLWIALQRYINEETVHHCELFKIPTRESNFNEVISSYEAYADLNLDYYHRVITGKYPAWLVQHHAHSIYMLHPLRGLYDTYHFCNLPTTFEYSGEALAKLKQHMDALRINSAIDNADLRPFFDQLEVVLHSGCIDVASFPSPFSRDVVHFLDSIAMQPGRIASYSAISRTVRNRADYFPTGANVGVAYPPPRLEGFYCKSDDYLFTTSRLDGPKRIALLIEAMRHVQSDIKLIIGGKGPDEERLKVLAEGDSRIVFAGYLNDSELLDYYANALAVPFVPYDEDYGLITIEAMRSGKPVITTTDAGGVTEFVIQGETGLLVAPDPTELAKAIDYLCSHRCEAKAMGQSARRLVSDISWHKVAEQLIGEPIRTRSKISLASPEKPLSKKKMVVAVTFPIYPPRGGGQSRIYNLYREWARYFDITIVSLTGFNEEPFTGEISPGLVEIRVPKSAEHQKIEEELSRTVDWVPVTDIVAPKGVHATPEYISCLEKACRDASVVVASHPFFVEILRSLAPQVPLWFEAHNVEYALKQNLLPKTNAAKELLDLVHSSESMAWLEAEVVYACSERDLIDLVNIYGNTKAKKLVVPNGFSTDEVSFTTGEMRARVKESIGLGSQPTVIFMGSWHGPNLEAVERIFAYADALPSVMFIVIGSAGLKFSGIDCPLNVKFVGVVDEKEKQVLLSAADLAINPMTSGSGSNLKMLDYFAAGVPVLSTPFGARGIDAEPGKHYISEEVDGFLFQITKFFVGEDITLIDEMRDAAAQLANKKYSWSAIATNAFEAIV